MEYIGFKNEYHSGKIHVYNGDCMDLLKQTPDKYYDLAIVDPPYGINISSAGGYYHVKGKGQANPHTKKDWDKEIPTAEYWDELFRVSKNQIVWGGNYMTEFLSIPVPIYATLAIAPQTMRKLIARPCFLFRKLFCLFNSTL